MNQTAARVLFLGRAANGLFRLRLRLETLGCACAVALASEQALAMADAQPFDLVLSTHLLHLTSPLLARLERSRSTAFFRLQVEDGHWWVPLLDHGSPCLGAPALRLAEFTELIDRIIAAATPSQPPAESASQAAAA